MTITMSSAHSPTFPSHHLRHNSFSKPSVALTKSQLILQPFRCFTYATVHSPTLLSLHLRHRLYLTSPREPPMLDKTHTSTSSRLLNSGTGCRMEEEWNGAVPALHTSGYTARLPLLVSRVRDSVSPRVGIFGDFHGFLPFTSFIPPTFFSTFH